MQTSRMRRWLVAVAVGVGAALGTAVMTFFVANYVQELFHGRFYEEAAIFQYFYSAKAALAGGPAVGTAVFARLLSASPRNALSRLAWVAAVIVAPSLAVVLLIAFGWAMVFAPSQIVLRVLESKHSYLTCLLPLAMLVWTAVRRGARGGGQVSPIRRWPMDALMLVELFVCLGVALFQFPDVVSPPILGVTLLALWCSAGLWSSKRTR